VTVPGIPETVDLGSVERTLAAMRGGDGKGSVRSTTLNLVVYAPDDDLVHSSMDVLSGVSVSHPLRALIVTPGEGKPVADVSSLCRLDRGGDVLSERVVIKAPPAGLPSAVVLLLVPDLPVFLWWRGDVSDDDALLRELAGMATRLIIDSDIVGVDAVERVCLFAPGLADLAWARLAPWRQAIAGLFDGRTQRRALDHLMAVEVRGPEGQARLLAGWLRSRLGRQIGLDVTKAQRMERVELHSGKGVFVVERSGRDNHGTASGPGIEPFAFSLGQSQPLAARMLAAELDELGGEPVFEEALAAA
jgi:glucose-6-phosphate dehydrogenase assembly protein OpcA